MKHKEVTRYSTAQALDMRASEPVHVAPGAQPVNQEISLVISHCPAQPSILVTDRQRGIHWRVGMQPANEAASWTAVLRMPSVPCMIDYHFEFAEGEPLYALRQVEALIPGTANPTFGAWMRQPFQITVYDPAAMPPLWAQGQVI